MKFDRDRDSVIGGYQKQMNFLDKVSNHKDTEKEMQHAYLRNKA